MQRHSFDPSSRISPFASPRSTPAAHHLRSRSMLPARSLLLLLRLLGLARDRALVLVGYLRVVGIARAFVRAWVAVHFGVRGALGLSGRLLLARFDRVTAVP